jgi:hypothetical protein
MLRKNGLSRTGATTYMYVCTHEKPQRVEDKSTPISMAPSVMLSGGGDGASMVGGAQQQGRPGRKQGAGACPQMSSPRDSWASSTADPAFDGILRASALRQPASSSTNLLLLP